MHFGLFVEEMRRGATAVSAFDDAFELADLAEGWGMDCVWLGEIHFTPTRSVISASLLVASSIATRTRRLRIGTAVQVLPLNHPLRIAEEIATIDQISKGRFEFGIGRSGVVRSYDIYGVPYGESQARFSHRGEFYRFENATVSPRPYQVPHPPIRMATTSHETFGVAGRLGLPIFVGLRATDMDDLKVSLASYRRAWSDAGHAGTPSAFVRIPVYTAATEKAALEEPRESISAFFARQSELARSAVGRAGAGPAERRSFQAERMANLSYDDVLAKKVAFGTPGQLIERLKHLQAELGIDGILLESNSGGLIPPALERESLRLFTHEVIPAFR
jgi:alkanesulfonate monooxygenase SsuD/methylene tetrahydromethanopterin reductase-like flavin-dependent oxidoreductase (luciferase family)